MTKTCVFTEDGLICGAPATHYLLCELWSTMWTIEDTPRQIYYLNGARMQVPEEGPDGKWLKDKYGKTIMRDVLHTPCFCLAHAQEVQVRRNASVSMEVA